jgi:hypothetical protein
MARDAFDPYALLEAFERQRRPPSPDAAQATSVPRRHLRAAGRRTIVAYRTLGRFSSAKVFV